MKTIGLIGGMSWESTAVYYRLLNEGVKEHLGGLHSAEIVMVSVDFEPIEKLQHAADWAGAARVLIEAARRVEAGGADFLLICANTMHRLADDVADAVGIPLLHIADATADAVRAEGLKRVGLLGTRFTIEEDFYKGRLTEQHGLEVMVPDERDREIVHRIIYDELCLGEIRDASRQAFIRIIEGLTTRGTQGIILGCTEIPLLVGDDDVWVQLFDTTAIHAQKAVALALASDD